MKYLRDATYVAGGYVVRDDRVLLLWHGSLSRWVPTGGRIELASGEYPHEALIREVQEETGLSVSVASGGGMEVRDEAASPLPMPVSIQEIRISPSAEYLDFVYFCHVVDGEVSLDYRAARAYHWFSKDDLQRFPLMPHVFAYASRALEQLSPVRS
ncbi:MAG TPA: NUDIX domain-containing protein [Streptosporangiaceae bacterium]|jgi:8-oxo-dGTP pyrophosphatase MutT (NUDIX family)|nr:NUDIX domain-containing protein [Streptosporangiaceae bacterium]